jgi:ABC-type transport system involved in multi-copper enzyme maturation permease subunit
MLSNPIIQRELVGMLRSRRALVIQVLLVATFGLLVILRWPSDPRVDLNGARSMQVFRLFGYGLLAAILLLVPAFPASSIVREKQQGTLALLLNTPMTAGQIYLGKLLGVMGFVMLVLVLSLPSAVACYAMGGISFQQGLLPLYVLLMLVALQYSSLGLLISSHATSTDSAMKLTYGAILVLAVVTLGPYLFLQGVTGEEAAGWLRSISPLPAVMEILGQRDLGGQGLEVIAGAHWKYALLAVISTVGMSFLTIRRLNVRIFDETRAQGVMTHELKGTEWLLRNVIYMAGVTDPQRRRGEISRLFNPVMVKEFRCRRFGRLHWILRLVCGCAILSFLLTFIGLNFTHGWGVERIGGILVILQVSLVVLLTPSITAGLISGERESGNWQLLQMTPMSGWKIVRGKLMSVVYTLLLLVMATLPAYVIMIYLKPEMQKQVIEVLYCLLAAMVFSVSVSAAISSLARTTAVATTASFCVLVTLFAGTLLFWLGEGAPFGHDLVEMVLRWNPLAAALAAMQMPGFTSYDLVPHNWYIMGVASLGGFLVLALQTIRLTRPQ